MKPDTISLRRRHLMMAGLAGVAAPVTVFAVQRSGTPRDALVAELSVGASGGQEKLVVSGRILRPDGKPLADALVEAWHAGTNGSRASVTTDADGRFMFTAIAPAESHGRPRHIQCRVSHKDHGTLVTQLHFAHEQGVPDDLVAHLQRDDTGVWRAAFGLTLS